MVYIENEIIGRRLATERRIKQLSYDDVAEVLGISEGHYRKIERGVHGLDIRKLLVLQRELGYDIWFVLTGDYILDKENGVGMVAEGKNSYLCEILDYCKRKINE